MTPTPMHTPFTAAMSGFDDRHRSTQSNATLAPVVPGSDAAAVALAVGERVADVGAGAERATGTGHDDGADLRARVRVADRLRQLAAHAGVPGVELLRPVEGDQQHVAALLGEDGLGHGRDRTGRGRDRASGPRRSPLLPVRTAQKPNAFIGDHGPGTEVPTSGGVRRVRVRCSKPGGGQREMRHGSVRVLATVGLAATIVVAAGAGARAHARGRPRRGRHGRLVRLRREPAARRDLRAGARARPACPSDRALGLGPRELVAPALVSGLVELVPEYAGHRGAVPQPRARRTRSPTWPRPTPPSSTRCDGHVGPCARAGAGAGRQRVRRAPRGRRPSRPRDAQRPRGSARATRPSAGRPSARPGRCASTACATSTASSSTRSCRSTPAVRSPARRSSTGIVDVALLFSTDPALAPRRPGRAGRRPRAPAGRERHAARPPGRGRPVRAAPRRHRSTRCRRGSTPTTLRALNARAARGSVARHRHAVARRGAAAMTVDDARGPTGPVLVTGPPTARRTRRRRRPTGAPPPLPRTSAPAGPRGSCAAGVLLVLTVVAASSEAVRRAVNQVDSAILRQFAGLRIAWLTDVADAIDRVASGWTISVDRLRAARSRCSCCKRWRHLFTLIGATFVIEILADVLYRWTTRPRPVRRHDHRPVGRLLVPTPRRSPSSRSSASRSATRWWPPAAAARSRKVVTAVVVADRRVQPALPRRRPPVRRDRRRHHRASRSSSTRSASSRPNEVFPVAYRKGKTAHLDVGGRRGEAIRHAVQDQLGLTVVEVEPFGLAGSGGSTPLRIRVDGDPDTYLFGKLYAMSHVRADRWYKLGRTILYGRLEDESALPVGARGSSSTRTTRSALLRDAGIPTAEPYGIVELTPEREYLLVTEFFDDATGDRRRRGRRRDHRRGPHDRPPALGRRARAPRHQAGQPARARRAPRCSSTSRSRRCARRRGARRSTSPT